MDDDHPDIPLGGWAGTISQVGKRGMYSVRWSRETLASIHPIYKKRFAIDSRAPDEYWLGEDDLEPDPGGPLSIEQPTEISPRPLSAEHEGDRVRMVFGLTSDDFLPKVDEESLGTYYDYLEERLSLPFEARYLDEAVADIEAETSLGGIALLLLEIIAFATSYGAVVGSAVAAMPWARWTACIGGGVWGVLECSPTWRLLRKT